MDTLDIRLKSKSYREWTSLVECVKNAVVFLDAKAGECIHWSIGTSTLLKKGALAIHDFNSYQFFSDRIESNAMKVVFMSPRPLMDYQAELCDILSQSKFRKAILISSPVLDPSTTLSSVKKDVIHWMAIGTQLSIQDLSVNIISFPFFIAPITESVIMLPSFRDVPLTPDCNKFSSLRGSVVTLSSREQEIVEHFALCLDSLLGEMNASDVVFSLGAFSGAVGTALESLSSAQQRRKVAQHKISVVIIDRSLDLCTPCSVDSNCFMDKILGALPHLPGHSVDVAVNMSPLAQATVDSAQEESIFPGCLAHHSEECSSIINKLIKKKKHEILMELHQALKSQAPSSKLTTRVKPESLEKDVRHFRGDFDKIHEHSGILQVALAVVQTLIGEHAEEAELLLSTQKVLCQSIATSEDNELTGLLPQVTKLVSERHIRGLSLDSLITLLILVYSLIGCDMPFPVKDEVQLQAALSSAIFEDQEYPGVTHAILVPLESSKENIDAVTANLFAGLKSISHARRSLTKYKSILRRQGKTLPAEHQPLLHQLLADILDTSEQVMPDILCHSTGLKDLLRSGFSLLLNKQTAMTSHHPCQQPNLLLVVFGGITGGEIKAIEDSWAASSKGKTGGTVLIASTALLSPLDTLKLVLKSAQLM